MTVSSTTAPHLAAHPCVAASGRALTHLEVRSLPSSVAPSAGLASCAAAGFGRSMADGPTERLVPVAARFR